MTVFITTVLVVLVVSAVCSLTEAAFYAVRLPYVKTLVDSGSAAGRVLDGFKKRMDRPIAAVLIVNTAANTAGAAIAGAQARALFGENSVVLFSAFFTLAVLLLSEIIPKVAGIVYSNAVARMLALPWYGVIRLLTPMIWLIELVTSRLKPDSPVMTAPEDEVQQMAFMSAEEGSIHNYEAELVQNVLRLDDITTRAVMTPRPVVKKLPSSLTVKQASEQLKDSVHSRIPVFDANDPENWTGVVMSRDILGALANDRFETTLDSISKPLHLVSESLPGHVLLKTFLKKKTHLFGVRDEYGDLTGIVALEDVLEFLIGEEIIDEIDTAPNLTQLAQERARDSLKNEGGDR